MMNYVTSLKHINYFFTLKQTPSILDLAYHFNCYMIKKDHTPRYDTTVIKYTTIFSHNMYIKKIK